MVGSLDWAVYMERVAACYQCEAVYCKWRSCIGSDDIQYLLYHWMWLTGFESIVVVAHDWHTSQNLSTPLWLHNFLRTLYNCDTTIPHNWFKKLWSRCRVGRCGLTGHDTLWLTGTSCVWVDDQRRSASAVCQGGRDLHNWTDVASVDSRGGQQEAHTPGLWVMF